VHGELDDPETISSKDLGEGAELLSASSNIESVRCLEGPLAIGLSLNGELLIGSTALGISLEGTVSISSNVSVQGTSMGINTN
jgi:hypothetical protein